MKKNYKKLGKWAQTLRRLNQGLVYDICCEDDKHFKHFYFSIGPCIRGFLMCMRPVLDFDGTFLKGKYKGVLIVCNAMDGNNQIYPITFTIVNCETDNSWTWFMERLKVNI